jgi:hypothetical protein
MYRRFEGVSFLHHQGITWRWQAHWNIVTFLHNYTVWCHRRHCDFFVRICDLWIHQSTSLWMFCWFHQRETDILRAVHRVRLHITWLYMHCVAKHHGTRLAHTHPRGKYFEVRWFSGHSLQQLLIILVACLSGTLNRPLSSKTSYVSY